jgi:hypothetical protein
MSEKFNFKHIPTQAKEFVTYNTQRFNSLAKENPKAAATIIGVPIAGFIGTVGVLGIFQSEKIPTPITCEVSQKWIESRQNSEERFNQSNRAVEPSASENKTTTPGNSNKDFTAVPKANESVRFDKIIGTITNVELNNIIGEKLNLNPKTRNDIPALTSVFNKVLFEIDKEKLLGNEEQMDLYSWFLKQYPTLVVADGGINPNNLTGFVDRFNIEAERLRGVGFQRLSDKNCVPEKSLAIVNTGNQSDDNKANLAIVAKLLDLEQADRTNNPVNKALYEEENARAAEYAAKVKADPKYAKTPAEIQAGEMVPANLPKARKPNISESEEIARKLLIVSNLLDPAKALSEDKIVRLYNRLDNYYKYQDKNSYLKDADVFRNDLSLLTAEIVAIDGEMRLANIMRELAENSKKVGMFAGFLALVLSSGFAFDSYKSRRKVGGLVSIQPEVKEALDKFNRDSEELKRIAKENKMIPIGVDENGNIIKVSNETLAPESKDSNGLRSVVQNWEEKRPDVIEDIVIDYIERNAEDLGIITFRNFDQLNRELHELKDSFNGTHYLKPNDRLKYDIEKLTNFLDILCDFVHNIIKANITNTSNISKSIVIEHQVYDREYIPKLRSILQGFLDDVEELDNPINLDSIEKRCLAEIESLSNSISRHYSIVNSKPKEKILSENEIDLLDSLFAKEYSKSKPKDLPIFKIWIKSNEKDFDLYGIAMANYLKGRRKTSEADVLASQDKKDIVEIKRKKLEADLDLFIKNFEEMGLSKEQMLAYHKYLNPKSALETRREKIANDVMGIQPLFARLFDESIIQNIIRRYDIKPEVKELEGMDFSGFLGGLTSVTRLINQQNEKLVENERFTIRISDLTRDLKCIVLDLDKIGSQLTPEVVEYRSQVMLPVLDLLSELNNYKIKNTGMLEELIEIYDQIKVVKSKSDRQMFIDEYNQKLSELTSDSNFVEFNEKLYSLATLEELLNKTDQNNYKFDKSIANILISSKKTIKDITEIFLPIEETLE